MPTTTNAESVATFRLGHRPALDGLRGVAILSVMAVHTRIPGTHGGFLGVTVFFVISGFLITTLLLEERDRTEAIDLGRFYTRRALRLLPALVALLGALTIYGLVVYRGHELTIELRRIGIGFGYVSNWVQAFRIDSMGYLGHTWTLAIEEQFYVVWPLVLILLTTSVRSPKKIAVIIAGGAVASAIWRVILFTGTDASWHRVSAGLDTRADALLVGCLLGVLVSYRLVPSRLYTSGTVRTVAHISCVVLVLMIAATRPADAYLIEGGYLLAAIAAAAAILDVVATPSGPLAHVLSMSPLVWVGRLSYSLYLWHVPVLELLRSRTALPQHDVALIGLLTSFALATASYFLVEQPFLRRKVRLARRREPADLLMVASSGALS